MPFSSRIPPERHLSLSYLFPGLLWAASVSPTLLVLTTSQFEDCREGLNQNSPISLAIGLGGQVLSTCVIRVKYCQHVLSHCCIGRDLGLSARSLSFDPIPQYVVCHRRCTNHAVEHSPSHTLFTLLGHRLSFQPHSFVQ